MIINRRTSQCSSKSREPAPCLRQTGRRGQSFVRVAAARSAACSARAAAARPRCCAASPDSRRCRKARSGLNGKVVSRPGSALPPEKRRIGMVFQDYALFPHLRIADNIAFQAPRPRRAGTRGTPRRAGRAGRAGGRAAEVPARDLRRPAAARRARARLAPRPELLLLDEPFSTSTSSCASACRTRCGTSSARAAPRDPGDA